MEGTIVTRVIGNSGAETLKIEADWYNTCLLVDALAAQWNWKIRSVHVGDVKSLRDISATGPLFVGTTWQIAVGTEAQFANKFTGIIEISVKRAD